MNSFTLNISFFKNFYENGKTILKEQKGVFSSSYKDTNGNTVYTKDTDIFGDNQIKDNNYTNRTTKGSFRTLFLFYYKLCW